MKTIQRKPNVGYLDNWLWVPKGSVDAESVKRALTMRFVDSYSEEKIRFVYLWRETEHHLLVPRHLWRAGGMAFRVVDCRPREYTQTGIKSRIKLDHRLVDGQLVHTGDTIQQKAMDRLLATDSGVLQLGCGRGKTVITLDYIARLGGPALILLDNTNLLEQWKKSIELFLDVPGGVGLVQGPIFDWKKGIVLSTYHTLGALAETLPEEFRCWFMLQVFDEGHHVAASTFAPAAEAIYGIRLILSATAQRDDGLNVIYDNHVGPTIYKDIVHRVKPRIVFKWTGLSLGALDPVYDKNGEVHSSKVASFFGQWQPRLSMILDDVTAATRMGRKVLVLCNAVDEAVNLCALWSMQNWHNPGHSLYTDIPIPTPMELGFDVPPVELTSEQYAFYTESINKLSEDLLKVDPNSERGRAIRTRKADLELQIRQGQCHQRVSTVLNKRQREYRNWLTENLTTAGLMIHKVPPEQRMSYIKTKRVIFGITKYGKEGLDDEALDTVLMCEPFSSHNGLQQLMGRPTRDFPGKQEPLVLIYEDNVSTFIGMCRKLRKHLNQWPLEENGPFEFEMHGHPSSSNYGHRPLF